MKELILSLTVIFFLSGGCKKNDASTRGNEKQFVEQASPFSIRIEPDSTLGVDIDSIYAVILTPAAGEHEVILGRAAYSNRGFEITIPAVLENNYLGSSQKVLLANHQLKEEFIHLSDSTASLSWPVTFNAYKAGNFIGNLMYVNEECGGFCQGSFFYADSSFSFSGYSEDSYYLYDYDIKFQKGWNFILYSFIYKKKPISEYLANLTNPDGFQWRFWAKDAINSL